MPSGDFLTTVFNSLSTYIQRIVFQALSHLVLAHLNSSESFDSVRSKWNEKTVTPILEANKLTKTYRSGSASENSLTVLKDVSFSVPAGGSCAIVGPSGSGKTTLLGLCAGLDVPTSGSVLLDGRDLGVRARRIADYIAGMTDRFALVEHARLFPATPELR